MKPYALTSSYSTSDYNDVLVYPPVLQLRISSFFTPDTHYHIVGACDFA